MTVNQELHDRIIRHAALLERYKRAEVMRILRFLDEEVYPDLVGRLEARLRRISTRGVDKGLWSTKRLQDMHDSIKGIIEEGMREARGLHLAEARTLAMAEGSWQAGLLSNQLGVFGIETVIPSPGLLREIVSGQSMNGALVKDWFKELDTSLLKGVTKQVNIGLATGETNQQIIRRVRGLRSTGYRDGAIGLSRRQAATVVQTSVANVTDRAQSEVNKANADILKGEMWSATLDHLTCPVCGQLDRKVFPLDEGPRPTVHPNCRCRRVPVVKSLRELGIDLPDLSIGTRASMDGQIPRDTAFPDWLKRQPQDTVADVLGSQEAARQFLAGDLPFSAFSTSTGKPLSLTAVMASS